LKNLFFGNASANQSQRTPWSDGGVTLIESGNIVTDAIKTIHIDALSITAVKLAVGSVTAGALAANSVTAVAIAANTITGGKIAANTITGVNMVADSITARELILTDSSNIVDHGFAVGDLSGWGTSGYGNYYLSTGGGDSDGWTYQSNGREQASSSAFAVSPGEVYFVDVWVYNTVTENAGPLLICTNAAGAGIGYPGILTAAKNVWTRIQGRLTIPSGAVKAYLVLFVDKPSPAGGQTYWSKPILRRAMSAELIVDGAITASKIYVTSLDAIAAALGYVDISFANIGTLQVGTSNIVVGAVTDTGASLTSGLIGCNVGVETTIQSVAVTTLTSSKVAISGMATIAPLYGDSDGAYYDMYLKRNGTVIYALGVFIPTFRSIFNGSSNDAGYGGYVVMNFTDVSPPPGSNTYIITVKPMATGISPGRYMEVGNRILNALVSKR